MKPGHKTTERLLIRPFKPSDLQALNELNKYGLQAAGILPEDDYYADADMASAEATYAPENGGTMLVGIHDGQIVAMGGIRRMSDTTCELLRMRVHPDCQGRHFGTAILNALENKAALLGYRRIVLITGEHQHPAVDLYSRQGYSVDKREQLAGIASVEMSKTLP
jgi:GNAT superfamily N-acetyltransferase